MAPVRYCNLIFQGGGVRTIAYAGALSTMPADVRVKGVGGTSGGAIVAALMATGRPPRQLHDVLAGFNLSTLVDSEALERQKRLIAAASELAETMTTKQGAIRRAVKYGGMAWRYWRTLRDDFNRTWNDRGFHKTGPLLDWLEDVLEKKTFAQIDPSISDLRIVAADVENRKYVVYNRKEHAGMSIAAAVVASAAIPIFFQPVIGADGVPLVDGGLLSNYPSFLFVNAEFPTIAFRLHELDPPNDIDTSADYVRSLLLTMTDAHDKIRSLPSYVHECTIKTPPGISATKFDLSPDDIDALVKSGIAAGHDVGWYEHTADKPDINFFDPKPHEVLEKSLRNANKLYDSFVAADWLEYLDRQVVVENWLDPNWTASYNRKMQIRVKGARPLFFSRFRVTQTSEDGWAGLTSIADMNFVCVDETRSDAVEPLPCVPASNGETEKGFLLFYLPPVEEATPRTIRLGFSIPFEFRGSLGERRPSRMQYSAGQSAKSEWLSLTFRILLHRDLPSLKLIPEFKARCTSNGIATNHPVTGEPYLKYEWETERVQVTARALYRVRIEF